MNIVDKVVDNIKKVIKGKDGILYEIVKGVIAGGHILIEDVPGVGKTSIAEALSKSFDVKYSRMQFTPDLLPTDILGVSIYNPKTMDFEFRKGPIFSNIVLVDEINRASPKTQAALLEAMEENRVSEGLTSYDLDEPFIVLATQNPIESEGVFILPEAELDRFIISIEIGYPDLKSEIEMLKSSKKGKYLASVASKEDLIKVQSEVKDIYVSDDIHSYIVRLSRETRKYEEIKIGISPRGTLALLNLSKASAYIKGRDYVIPEDVRENVKNAFSHRIILSDRILDSKKKRDEILTKIVERVSIENLDVIWNENWFSIYSSVNPLISF